MGAQILIVDDDAALLDILSLSLTDAGFVVSTAVDGARALEIVGTLAPDVIVSDINMPNVDGFTLCRQLRARGFATPILLLTSRDNDVDEALGLELGADDYVTKPFSTRVLIARVAALVRRSAARAAPEGAGDVLRAGSIALDLPRMEARVRGIVVELTVTEFRLLQTFIERAGRMLSRVQLLEILRDDGSVVADRIIDTYVRRLRKKLGAIDPGFDAIETVIGAGYRWRVAT